MNDIILDSLPLKENDVPPCLSLYKHNSQSESELGKLKFKYVNGLIRMKDSNSIIYNTEVNKTIYIELQTNKRKNLTF